MESWFRRRTWWWTREDLDHLFLPQLRLCIRNLTHDRGMQEARCHGRASGDGADSFMGVMFPSRMLDILHGGAQTSVSATRDHDVTVTAARGVGLKNSAILP